MKSILNREHTYETQTSNHNGRRQSNARIAGLITLPDARQSGYRESHFKSFTAIADFGQH